MSKADVVLEKLARKQKSDTLKNYAYGTIGGAAGAVTTQMIDTISNVQQKDNLSIGKTIKKLNQEAAQIKLNDKTISILNKLPKAEKLEKMIKVLLRYNKGLLPKVLKIGPATGVAWGTANYLKNKFK